MGKKAARVKKLKLADALPSDVDISDDDDDDVQSDSEMKAEGTSEIHSLSDDSDLGDDSDRELQIAFRDGLLKGGLNRVTEKKRPIINKVDEMRAKLSQREKHLPWLETLDVSVSNDEMTFASIENEFEREFIFYKQAEKAAHIAVPRLIKMGVKVFRPADYYAEMAKSDDQMQKVRKRMMDIKEGKERQEAIRRMREEKKYAARVQKEVLENRQSEKKKLLEAVKKHRKGMKAQLDDMLSNARGMQSDEEENSGLATFAKDQRTAAAKRNKLGSRMSRLARDRKFGFGGQKKRSKKNDSDSFGALDFPGAARLKRGGRTSRGGKAARGQRGRARGAPRRAT